MSARSHRWIGRALRAPGRLYDWRLGGLLGQRFLRLTHRGRISGRTYETMLEVLLHDRRTDEYVVMSGLGHRSDWWRNVRAGGAVEVRVGRRRFRPNARRLSDPEAAEVMRFYERSHPVLAPVVRVVLSRLGGRVYDGSERSRRELVARLPVIALSPDR